MLRGASEIFGWPRRTCHFCIYCACKVPKRTLPREANEEVGQVIRSVWGYMRNCAYRRSLLLFPTELRSTGTGYRSLKGPKARSRSKYEEALSDLGRIEDGTSAVSTGPAYSRLALQNRAPRGYHTARDRPCRYTSRGRADTDSTLLWVWLSSFDSNVNSPYSKTVCSRERALK
jgi:hypothetical protein